MDGQNNYKLSHIKKGYLLRDDALPTELEVPVVRESIRVLIEEGREDSISYLMSELGMDPI